MLLVVWASWGVWLPALVLRPPRRWFLTAALLLLLNAACSLVWLLGTHYRFHTGAWWQVGPGIHVRSFSYYSKFKLICVLRRRVAGYST